MFPNRVTVEGVREGAKYALHAIVFPFLLLFEYLLSIFEITVNEQLIYSKKTTGIHYTHTKEQQSKVFKGIGVLLALSLLAILWTHYPRTYITAAAGAVPRQKMYKVRRRPKDQSRDEDDEE